MSTKNFWKITDISSGDIAFCDAYQVREILVDMLAPWECVDKYVANEIYAACDSISEQCISQHKAFDFGSICTWLNIRLDQAPEDMTEEDFIEFMSE